MTRYYEKEVVRFGNNNIGTVQRVRKMWDGGKWLAESVGGGRAICKTKKKAIAFLRRSCREEYAAAQAFDLRKYSTDELVAELTARTNETASEDQGQLEF